jgi:PmbA protein
VGRFANSKLQFQDLAQQALAQARKVGASDAQVEVSEGQGMSVGVRSGQIENVEHNRDKSLSISVYDGQRRGHASTSDFSAEAIARTAQAAFDIARYTAEDDCAGLPDAEQLATGKSVAALDLSLDLYHPWDLTPQTAAKIALRAEKAAFAVDPRIRNSEGASVSAQESHFVLANSRGFCDGYATSSHSLSCAPIAGRGDDMQRDYWWTSECDPADLASPEAVGRYAAERALSRLKARKLSTRKCPVLFESPLASGLISSFTHAISGGALYRKSSFLQGSLGQQVWADHIDLIEDPSLPKRRGSSPFDSEGVATHKRSLVDGGVVQGYLLGTYSARKLGMQTTGNAGGAHNLLLQSRLTQAKDDLRAMLRKLDTGLFAIELMGHGVNYVTGDYSRGVMGFWVEGGKIRYPVQEITIAGNLRDMLRNVVAVGADVHTYGSKTTGSILIDGMTVGGAG